ncbi:PQQ-binding-like beta-propeller repeat protein [Hyphococcus sp.]|jgi:outer membrane protein assembly factor BamB|uniref:outer membrane protein assembly factor BamB family protein n=1 Tax=Hyphococcus sp. TaxID=2038636 RepID=UPI003D0A42A8
MKFPSLPVWRALLLVSGFALISACGTLGIGGDKDKKAEEEEEDDERISILALDEQLIADPRYAGTTIDIPPSYVNASWTQPGGEADHTLHHLSAPLELKTLWKADVGDASARRARLTSPPIVVDTRVFVLDAETKVTAFDTETGDIVWRTELAPDIDERFRIRDLLRGPNPAEIGFGGGVAFENGRIFVTSGFGFVAALDAQTGEELWRVKTEAPARTPPTAYRGRVYLSTNTNEFLALNQETGERDWSFQSFEEAARFLSSSSPAAAGDLVVAPFSSGELVAFLADSGRSVWDMTLARQSRLTSLATLNDIAGSPVIDRGLVYVVSHGGRFSAIDIRTGRPVWEASIASLQMPWVAGDYIFLVSVDGELVCVSRNDGAIVWVTELRRYKKEKKKKGRITWAGPVLAGDSLILVSSEGEIVKVAPETGEITLTDDIDGSSVVSPVVAGEKVFILTEEGKLIALR